jgi:hypothetical protein
MEEKESESENSFQRLTSGLVNTVKAKALSAGLITETLDPTTQKKKIALSLIPNERKTEFDDDDFDDDELGSPVVILLYDFLTDPSSSKQAYAWSCFTCIAVIVRVMEIGVESVNGPNQYRGRLNRSRYDFLFSDEQYYQIYIACFIPLIIDAFVRVIMFLLLICEEENRGLYIKFKRDFSEKAMFFADTVGVIPFFVYAGYVRPNSVYLDQFARIVLRVMELLTTGRIFRAVRQIPAVRAISTALKNSFEDLVLPVFFFFIFNITAGVFFYFAEPCYEAATCPWISLFESTFYSIVTMTTSKFSPFF